jgi:hypothetical protein
VSADAMIFPVAGWEHETIEWRLDYMEALAELDKEFPAAKAANTPHSIGAPIRATQAQMMEAMKDAYRATYRPLTVTQTQINGAYRKLLREPLKK